MTNTITIQGVSASQIKTALNNWINAYSKVLTDGMQFELCTKIDGHYLLNVDPRLNNMHFYFLINYLKYPEGVKYSIDIKGYTIGESDSAFSGQKVMIYVSKHDKEYDNVYAVTESNVNYKVDFGGSITTVQDGNLYSAPNIGSFITSETITFNKKKALKKGEDAKAVSTTKRFKIISLIVIALLGVIILLPTIIFDTHIIHQITLVFCIGIGSWLLSDTQILRIDRLYLFSMLLSFLVIGVGYFLIETKKLPQVSLSSFFLPFSLLIVQWPSRRIFKSLFNREPTVDNVGPFSDRVYSIILFLGMIFIAFGVVHYLN